MRSAVVLLGLLLLSSGFPPCCPERGRQQRRGGGGGAEGRPPNKAAKVGQTYSSRLKRKGLAVDFTFSPFFRNYLFQFFGRARSADCRLVLDCEALGSSLEGHPRAGVASVPDSPPTPPSPLSKRRSKKQPNQVVLEVGWADTGRCGDPRPSLLVYNLTEVFLRWSASTEGRLRIRLMPERRAPAGDPKREEIVSAAIRGSEPRVWLQISFADVSRVMSTLCQMDC
ncbi:ALK tyrosine kinase receptor-like [Narcine bancroftii]|uniref:ALK tyrosine kinase receptor-like n=1 Tax=Narcine bancroftii TaxID=1343680 RepID=UPI0038319C79